MPILHVKLLGAFEARLDKGPPLFATARKAQGLLAYLALSRGQPRTRQHLADLLWASAQRSRPVARCVRRCL